MAQVVLDDLPHPDRLVHRALEEAEAVPPFALRLVESGVGEPHQDLVVVAVLRRERDADRDADRDLGVADAEAAAERFEDAPRQRLRILARSGCRSG